MSIQLATDWSEAAPQQERPEGIAPPEAVPLIALGEREPDPERTLLGHRFLCTGGRLFFVGPSGIGKSSAGVQQDLLWGLGRPAFGIVPARPLRILTVQAENDDGDLGEMVRGVSSALNLTAEDKETIRDSVLLCLRTGAHGGVATGRGGRASTRKAQARRTEDRPVAGISGSGY